MKTSKTLQNKGNGTFPRHVLTGGLAAMAVAFFGVTWGAGIGLAQEGDNEEQGVQVLTRGPVHEAFAGVVTFNPVAGVVVEKAPPEAIEEIPPAERPEGNNITWIPGYWAWDDERTDYLWVSGTWRALPPGRQWMAGYWGNTTQGHQWTSGYWANSTERETTYLPAPPATVEDGPNTRAPSRDYGWTPGNWAWRQERYAWSPGYWARGRADWDWIPAHYVWTPRGHIFVEGYWDYSVERRGTLFAPVYFDRDVYSRSGYSYSPSIVLGLSMFAQHLFLRPNYHHYYVGDYYGNRYNQGGYYAAHNYQSSRYGYDPIYSHQRWANREDQGWDERRQESYRYLNEHENSRPPHTWDAMRKVDVNSEEARQYGMIAASPIEQLAKRKDGSARFQSVAKEDRKMLAQRSEEMRKIRNERRTIESNEEVRTDDQKPGETAKIRKAKLPTSPIVGKPIDQFKKGQAPPEIQRTSESEKLDQQPQPEARDRRTKQDKDNQLPEPRKNEAGEKSRPTTTENMPRDKQRQLDRPEKGEREQTQPAPERREKKADINAPEQPRKNREPVVAPPKNSEKEAQPERERQMKKPQPEPERQVRKAQPEPDRQVRKPQPEPDQQRKAQPEPERQVRKAQPEPERQVRKAQPEPERQVRKAQPEKAPQPEVRPRAKEKAAADSNETEQPNKRDRK